MASYRIVIFKDRHNRKWYIPQKRAWYSFFWQRLIDPLQDRRVNSRSFTDRLEVLNWTIDVMRRLEPCTPPTDINQVPFVEK